MSIGTTFTKGFSKYSLQNTVTYLQSHSYAGYHGDIQMYS